MPGTWRLILDAMAADGEIPGPRTALHSIVDAAGIRPDEYRVLERHFVNAAVGVVDTKDLSTRQILTPLGPETRLLLDDPWAQRQLAIRALHRALVELEAPFLFEVAPHAGETVHPEIPQMLGAALRDDELAITRLQAIASQCTPTANRALAVSVLVAAGGTWSPPAGMIGADLRGAMLNGAHLPGAELRFVQFLDADFTSADLRDATLAGCNFTKADLTGASLCRANIDGAHFLSASAAQADFSHAKLELANLRDAELTKADFRRASLAGADFRGATLKGALFGGAKMQRCDLRGATLDGADFCETDLYHACLASLDLRGAIWSGAVLRAADLTECNLEGVLIEAADMERAQLFRANLTGARLPRARLRGAKLRAAMLGMVDLEGADLRDTDMRNAIFHMGSSRSGLLFDAPAGEGSRTGFYTDEFGERIFRNPEEIRVANLRGADLRGATLIDVDFYLVDLRDALYDSSYAAHLRSCGAILNDGSAAA